MSGRALIAVLALCGGALGAIVYRADFTAAPPRAPRTALLIEAPRGTPPARPMPVGSPSGAGLAALPASVRIQVPYTPQAPRGDWPTHEDYCEAAALLMYSHYLRGDHSATIPAATAEREMDPLVAWERRTFDNPHPDLTLAQIGQEAGRLFGFRSVVQPATLDAVREQLARGNPVIIPVMTHGAPGGAKLTPYYGSGNVYHVLLLIGYTADGHLIADDGGFMQGRYWQYRWPTLWSAMEAQMPRMNQAPQMLTLAA
ncbi:MAG: C39 family peptidase [Candidatus Dormibacteraceae bacterium]